MSTIRWLALACVLTLAFVARTDLLRRRVSLALVVILLAAGVVAAYRDGWLVRVRIPALLGFLLTIGAGAYPAFRTGVAAPLYEAAPALVAVFAAWALVLWLPPVASSSDAAARVGLWDRLAENRAASRAAAVGALVVTALVLVVLHEWMVRDYRFSTSDETFYLVQSGWFSLPSLGMRIDPDVREFFRIPFGFFAGDTLVTQYPPGWPAVLAIFSRLGVGEWSGALLGGTSVALTYALGRRTHGVLAGALAAALLASHSWFYQTHVGLLSHPLTMLAAVTAAWLVVGREDLVGARAALTYAAAGAALALAVAARPLTGLALAISVEAWRILRSRSRWKAIHRAWPWYAVGGAPVIAALLVYNVATTGHPFVFGYAATHGSLHALGFGERGYLLMAGGKRAAMFTPGVALDHLLARAGEVILNVPGLALLAPVVILAMGYGYRVRPVTVAAFLVLPIAQFFYFNTHWRFYTELLPFLFLGVAALLAHVTRLDGRSGAILVSACLAGNIAFAPETDLMRYRTGDDIPTGIRWLERMGRDRRILVILPPLREDGGRAFRLFAVNRAGENGRVIVVPNTDRPLGPLLSRFADRTPIRARWSADNQRLEFHEIRRDTIPAQSSQGRQLRGTRTVAHGTGNRHVLQLPPGTRAPQEQSAAAHVSATNEVDRKQKPLSKGIDQRIDVLRRRDAAEKHNGRGVLDRVGELLDVATQRAQVSIIARSDVYARETKEIVTSYALPRRDETTIGGDDENRRCGSRRPRERVCVGELASEVEPTEEAEHLADRRGVALTHLNGKGKRGSGAQEQLRAPSVAAGRREKENSRWIHAHDGMTLTNDSGETYTSTSLPGSPLAAVCCALVALAPSSRLGSGGPLSPDSDDAPLWFSLRARRGVCPRRERRRRADPHAAHPDRERDTHRVRLRQEHLGRGTIAGENGGGRPQHRTQRPNERRSSPRTSAGV